MKKEQYKAMMDGLIFTITEKFCVLGIDAIVGNVCIKNVVADLESFWNSDGVLSEKDYEHEAELLIMNFTEQFK